MEMLHTVVWLFIRVVIVFMAAIFVWMAVVTKSVKTWAMAAGAVALAVVAVFFAGCAPIPKVFPADPDLVHVIDGDTIKLAVRYGKHTTVVESVRFNCVNAEHKNTERGKLATARLRGMVAQGKRFEVYDEGARSYGRIVGRVLIDGYDPQVILRAEGLVDWLCGDKE